MNNIITLDYGSGGKKTAELIDEMIVPAFANEALDELGDGAVLHFPETESVCQTRSTSNLIFSTDSFVVSPYFFSGGDIGKLAVCGTVNDIAVSGGRPEYFSLGLILEEGLPMDDLKRIIDSIRLTAEEAGVKVVTGDTKVVEKGKGDGIYINTSGVGRQVHANLSPANICEGDAVLVSGPVGNHGVAVMLARNPDFLKHEIRSDCAPVFHIAEALFALGRDLKVMRDPTRGGIATTLCEFADVCGRKDETATGVPGNGELFDSAGLGIELEETAIPVDADVKAACDILGLDPFYCACEGRLLAVVSPEKEEEALQIMRAASGEKAAVIGHVSKTYPGRVVLHTSVGGTRLLSKLTGSQLPRIC